MSNKEPTPTGPVAPSPEADDPEGEMLDTGQEEVFSRAEIERGLPEHAAKSGRKPEGRA